VRKNKDHIYTNNIKMPVQPGIILSDMSDHLPTFVLIKSSCLKQKHSSITLRHNYKNLDKSTFFARNKRCSRHAASKQWKLMSGCG